MRALALATSGLRVLPPDRKAPVVAESTVDADLLEPLQIVTERGLESVRVHVHRLASLVVLLPVEEPGREAVVLRLLDDLDDLLNLLRGELASALREVNLGPLAHHVGEPASDARDRGQRVNDVTLAIDVGVLDTQDVRELSGGNERLWYGGGAVSGCGCGSGWLFRDAWRWWWWSGAAGLGARAQRARTPTARMERTCGAGGVGSGSSQQRQAAASPCPRTHAPAHGRTLPVSCAIGVSRRHPRDGGRWMHGMRASQNTIPITACRSLYFDQLALTIVLGVGGKGCLTWFKVVRVGEGRRRL